MEKAAAVAAAGSGEQRGSYVGGAGAAVAAMVEAGAAAAAAVVSSRLAGGLGLVLIPAWTHRRSREGDSEPGRLGITSFRSLMQASRNAATS